MNENETMNTLDVITKRIDALKNLMSAMRAQIRADQATLKSELDSNDLVDSARLMGWAQRLAKHEADIAATELAIRELSTIACIVGES